VEGLGTECTRPGSPGKVECFIQITEKKMKGTRKGGTAHFRTVWVEEGGNTAKFDTKSDGT